MSSAADVAIIDSGGANIASLRYALDRLGARSIVSADTAVITAAPRVLLPGVGAAPEAMARLRASGLDQIIPRLRVPLLGICLGMQLLFEHSAEGDTECLGVFGGQIERLRAAPALPVPHMGWNTLEIERDDPLLAGINALDRVYFVHSFAALVSEHTLASTQYGTRFCASVRRDNFCGVQFHPERSSSAGARILSNFLALPCC
ncbi:MAG TPA: imidazole glycerol phosphate synthase subunit HisH [Steroidobacteraceae bacterium]|nr:imidazole glycerol phosphate synthase subunit HisH [Steroidobacteraceae bacterium]